MARIIATPNPFVELLLPKYRRLRAAGTPWDIAAVSLSDRSLDTPKSYWILLGSCLVVFLTYARVLGHDLVVWDDPVYIALNPLVSGWTDAPWSQRIFTPNLGYPAPLPVAIYAAASTFGADIAPRLIHVASVLAHLANTVLFALLAGRWLQSRRAGVAAATIWAVHPVTSEAVAWAANLKEPLFVLGVLLALYGWENLAERGRRNVWRALVAVGVLVALGSKPTGGILGVLLIARALTTPTHVRREQWIAAATIAVIGAGWIALAVTSHGNLVADQAASFASRDFVSTMLSAVGVQAHNYVWLGSHEPYYPIELSRWTSWSSGGAVVAAGYLVAFLWAVRRRHDQLAFVVIAIAIAYAPYSNLIPLPRFTSDTYAYLASGFFAIALVGASRRALPDTAGRTPTLVTGLLVVVLSVFAFEQAGRWRSTEALFGPLLGEPERFALPYALVSYEFHLRGDAAQATRLLNEAWPALRDSHALPGFAWQAFRAVGQNARASDALVRSARLNGPRAVAAAAATIEREGLPVPETQAARDALRSSPMSASSREYFTTLRMWEDNAAVLDDPATNH